MTTETLPDWIAAICAVLMLILGLMGKILWGLRCYDRRIDKVEADLQHSNAMQMSAVEEVREDLKHEQVRRDQIWDKLDAIESVLGAVGRDVSFLRGQIGAKDGPS